MWRDGANLLDMLIWARRASDYVRERTNAEFAADALLQDATIRCVEVVGEAASRVSAEVWQAARDDCPRLVAQLEPLVPHGNPALPAEWEFL